MDRMCRVLGVSRSGYPAYVAACGKPLSAARQQHQQLLRKVREIQRRSGQSYGARRVSAALKQQGFAVGRMRSATRMRQAGVPVRHRRRFRCTTDSKHDYPLSPNHLNRQFQVAAPNQVWTTDISYLWTQEGWLYLAIVMDLYSRRIVGWSLGASLATSLVQQALHMALARRRPNRGLWHHSDRGSQ